MKEESASRLDVLKKFRTHQMRPRAQNYVTLEGLAEDRDAVPWYWRAVAAGSSFMILGGYLMLPATFEDHPDLRLPRDAVGIFAVALLTAGLSFTGLVCFAVRNALFQRDSVFLPSLVSCSLGLLTIIYDFLIFTQYQWKTPAVLTTIAASVSTVVYAALLFWSQHKVKVSKRGGQPSLAMPLTTHQHHDSESTLWHEPQYNENYTRNMFPTAHHPPVAPAPQPVGYHTQQITEEEMQRQQMLMLLLQRKDQSSTPDPTASTFHLDWQGGDEEDVTTPATGYYAPHSAQSPYPSTAYPSPTPGLVRQLTHDLRPWDGVWRTPATINTSRWQRSDARRAEIESRGR